jgi:uncharacterized cupin superfamily protein
MPEEVEGAGPVGEAELVEGEDGLVPDGDGWFIVNVADSDGLTTEKLGSGAMFEATIGDFPEFGINVRLLEPGQPASMYHRESSQEAFIVLSGEVTAIVEDEERPMHKGDFLHMPPGTAHVIVGAGDGPSSVLMVGARRADSELEFPVSEPAARFGASVEAHTSDAATANADVVPRRARLGRVPW